MKTTLHKLGLQLVIVSLIAALLSGCTAPKQPETPEVTPAEVISDTPDDSADADEQASSGTKVEDVLKRIMPGQMQDGAVRVAVIRNLSNGDHTRLFISGCIMEGIALGFEVETFITDGDNAKCQEIIAEAIAGNYDGIILSHGGAYTYDALLPAVEKGMKVVTFDSLPFKDGDVNNEILEGVTSTAQEDIALAQLSLDAIVNNFDESKQPIKVIRAWMGPDVLPLDIRKTVYDQYIADGKIQELAFVEPVDNSNPRGGTKDALAAILPDFPAGSVDAIWGCYDELAKGCLDALNEAGRTDIKIMSIDISDNDMDLMRTNKYTWLSTAAVDPKLIGIVNMRLLAMKFAGEPTPDTYYLEAQLVETAMLDDTVNMSNIAKVVEGWGRETGIFDNFDWMDELKAITFKY